jgi:hypothetical protein
VHAIDDHGNTERPPLRAAALLRDVHPLDRQGLERLSAPLHPIGQLHLGLGRQHYLAVNARSLATGIALRYAPHAQQRVRA